MLMEETHLTLVYVAQQCKCIVSLKGVRHWGRGGHSWFHFPYDALL